MLNYKKRIIFLFWLLKIYVCVSGSLYNDKKNIRFFTDRLVLKESNVTNVSLVNSRYLIEPFEYHHYNLKLLEICTDFNLNINEERQNINDSMISSKLKNPKIIFVKELQRIMRNILSENDSTKFQNSMNHFQCHQSIQNCGFKYFGPDLVAYLIKTYPKIMKNHLKFVTFFDNFSFLTKEIALILYEDRNFSFYPFYMTNFVNSAKFEVIIALLELWEYEFDVMDVKLVIDRWGENAEFLKAIDKDPRSWLLWIKLDIHKPFPIEKLSTIPDFNKGFSKYTNLFLAALYQTEFIIFKSLCNLEYIYANLVKAINIEGNFLDSGRITNKNLRIWNLWFEAGQADIKIINDQLNIKNQIAELIKEMETDTNEEIIANILLILCKIPLINFNRTSFNQSFDYERLISAAFNSDISLYYFRAESQITPWNLARLDFWTVMWNDLNNHGNFEFPFDTNLSIKYDDPKKLIELLIFINHQSRKIKNCRIQWHVFLILMLIKPTNDVNESDFYLKSLNTCIGNNNCKLGSHNFKYLHSILAPESSKKYLNHDTYLAFFQFSPEILTRTQIKLLINDMNMREILLENTEKVMKLCSLADFNADDLLLFFPIGCNYHLEFHKALFTVDPVALVGYLRGIQGALNYPEQFVMSVHPRAWNNFEFVDLVSENIPYVLFLKFPIKAQIFNFAVSICDVTGRILRSDMGLITVKKLIVKWAITMEWIFSQFHVINCINQIQFKNFELVYLKFVENEKIARLQLVTWLKFWYFPKNPEIDLLIRNVESLPLSYKRLAMCHDIFVEAAYSIQVNQPNPNFHLAQFFDQFLIYFDYIESPVESHAALIKKNEENTCNYINITFGLIEKYFDPIEKIVWRNRLSVITLISIDKYSLHPKTSTKFLSSALITAKVPIYNLQVAYDIFAYVNFENWVLMDIETEFICSREYGKIIMTRKKGRKNNLNIRI